MRATSGLFVPWENLCTISRARLQRGNPSNMARFDISTRFRCSCRAFIWPSFGCSEQRSRRTHFAKNISGEPNEYFENMMNSVITVLFNQLACLLMVLQLVTHDALAENRTLIRQSDWIQPLTIIAIVSLIPLPWRHEQFRIAWLSRGLPLNLASSTYVMQPAILSPSVSTSDYIRTLLLLTLATLIVIINLPYVLKLVDALRKAQASLWRCSIKTVHTPVKWITETKIPSQTILPLSRSG